jgi:hypothetical protein
MSDKNLEYFLLGLLGGVVIGAVLMTLFEGLAPLLFGWPVILLAILVSILGLLLGRPIWLVLGAFLIIPSSFYLGGSPRFRIWAWFLPLLHLAAAYALQRRQRWLAALLLLPYLALIAWLGWSVLNQG